MSEDGAPFSQHIIPCLRKHPFFLIFYSALMAECTQLHPTLLLEVVFRIAARIIAEPIHHIYNIVRRLNMTFTAIAIAIGRNPHIVYPKVEVGWQEKRVVIGGKVKCVPIIILYHIIDCFVRNEIGGIPIIVVGSYIIIFFTFKIDAVAQMNEGYSKYLLNLLLLDGCQVLPQWRFVWIYSFSPLLDGYSAALLRNVPDISNKYAISPKKL